MELINNKNNTVEQQVLENAKNIDLLYSIVKQLVDEEEDKNGD